MGATFLMSYPGPGWTITGGQNFRSEARAATNPRAALREWLTLADAITRHGGRILVLPPPSPPASLTGLLYTANTGALFRTGDQWTWLLAKMSVAHRQAEREHLRAFWSEAGVPVADATQTWEGQADVTLLPGNRAILTWGVRSTKESAALVRSKLPPVYKVLEAQLREPWFHGDTALNALTTRAGDTLLLAYAGALVDRTVPELRTFAGGNVEVLSIDEDDARGYACNALCIDGAVIMPSGLSTGLRGNLLRRGFKLDELDLPELFGKGGGGPRCLVNELRGFVLTAAAPDYVSQRDHLQQLVDRYPESVAPVQEAK